jgi:hypothetical protein
MVATKGFAWFDTRTPRIAGSQQAHQG